MICLSYVNVFIFFYFSFFFVISHVSRYLYTLKKCVSNTLQKKNLGFFVPLQSTFVCLVDSNSACRAFLFIYLFLYQLLSVIKQKQNTNFFSLLDDVICLIRFYLSVQFAIEFAKEQLQKLAGHMEFMKIVHMGVNNPHLKPKPGGYFSHGNVATSAAAAAVVSVAAATSVATVAAPGSGPGSTSPSTAGESSLLQKRGASLLEPAVVHFNYESDVLLSRKSSSRQIQPSSLGVVVDDANVLDDSPTAELLPNSGPSKLWLVVNSEEVWLWKMNDVIASVSIWCNRLSIGMATETCAMICE